MSTDGDRAFRAWGCILTVVMWILIALAAWLMFAGPAGAACEYYEPDPPNEPTGVKGCEVYGEGLASMWAGPGVARNDCVYPWTACASIRITSLETGISVDRTPTMYCDCYTGTADERLVDLDPPTVAALGLNPDVPTLHGVRVERIGVPISDVMLPDTMMADRDKPIFIALGIVLIVFAIIVAIPREKR